MKLNPQEILETHKRILPYVHNTPMLTSQTINSQSGAQVFFKCENFQKMGAFKMRGAVNAILQLSDEERKRGVVTHSSGNFAQALSLAAKSLNVPAFVVMPNTAPQVKKDAVKGYGGEIIECPPTLTDREHAANQIVLDKGATFLHPSNNWDVILGQGTAALELLSEIADLDYILTPVGGGGLVAGTILATLSKNPSCRVIGAEPSEADDAYRSLISGEIETNTSTYTIADGLKTQLGSLNFPVIRDHIDAIIRVEETEIIAAMQLIWERMKIIVEPSAATTLAVLLKEKERFANKKIGIILSGGNVDLKKLPF
ncbi:pyridoxal-phosphate dependent enzyme [Aquimarina intermedia]|uniref:Threonine dehydratase n=1 Tax=Aquimarina intermedia TaxID=350814 RepID=A0A5S5C2E8_9FLAO|nr:pyridoxal-phosphate dependent enzyme [Aquimarina intermedia]TYP72143.1 threonine dehydratase [Aquimarina intermedia]